MRTFAFTIFVVVTAAAAAVGTLAATRYLSLEKELAAVNARMEDVLRERTRQEEEKMALRLEFERQRTELEVRFAEQHSQLEECANQRQRDFQELLTGITGVNKRLTDILVHQAPSTGLERPQQPAQEAPPEKPVPDASSKANPAGKPEAHSASSTDIPKGAIPTPSQEARRLNQPQ